MKNTDNIQNRINEIIAELSECREDERNCQNQILQVISLTGTVLGLLTGISFLNTGKNGIDLSEIFSYGNKDGELVTKVNNLVNNNVTYARVMFWLGLLVFIAAFSYMLILGINNLLRYYYIQALEDRLQKLIREAPDNRGKGSFLHWNAYIAPIVTRNPKHVASTHTALHYVCLTLAVICVVILSMVLVIALYLQIDSREWFDKMLLASALATMLITFVLFLRLSANAESVAQFAWEMAHDNQKIRLRNPEAQTYKKSSSFRRTLGYLIYPKKQDLQKPILIIIGFLFGVIFVGAKIDEHLVTGLLIVLFVFDFLAYQARYQINDIRGIEEDKEAGNTNRLIADDTNNPEYAIKISSIVALFKIVLALIITLLLDNNIKNVLLSSLGILLISTIIYEVARKKEIIWLIFASVGIGYPLRFFVGFFTVVHASSLVLNLQVICFIIAFGAYGSFSSILSWTNQVSELMRKNREKNGKFPNEYKKAHFKVLQDNIKERYENAESAPVNGLVMPLREKGKIYDVWNMFFVISLIFGCLTAYFGNISSELLVLECFVCLVFGLNGCLERKNKLILMVLGWLCILMKAFLATIVLKDYIWYLLLCSIQCLITGTYFVLCYQPQVRKVAAGKLFKDTQLKIVEIVLGEYAKELFENKEQ